MKKMFVSLEPGDKVYGAYHDKDGYYVLEGVVVSNKIEERESCRGPAWDSTTVILKEHVLKVSFNGIDEVYSREYEPETSNDDGLTMSGQFMWPSPNKNPSLRVFIDRKTAVEYNVYWAKTFLDRSNSHLNDAIAEVEKSKRMLEIALNLEEPEKEEGSEIPKTVEEAVSTLGRILSDEDREYLLENGAVSMHDSLGRWIRNEWGLWTDSELKNELNEKGFDHPDDMSNYIIEEFIKYWNGKRID